MLRFIGRAFAIIGFLVTLIIAAIAGLGFYVSHSVKKPEAMVLRLDFDRSIVEQNDPSPFDLALNDKPPVALLNLLSAIDSAATDPHVKGIVARFGSTLPSMSDVQEIRAAMARFRASGKFTYAYATSYGEFGMSNRPYYLASAFENIWLQPVGSVGLTGTAILSPFAKTALDNWGVKADFMQRDEYKSAMDIATQTDFTPPVRQMMAGLINDMTGQIAQGIADSRGWKIEHVKDLMSRGPYTSNEAMKEGLVTRLGFTDTLDEEIKTKAGKDVKGVSVEEYLSYGKTNKKTTKDQPTIALIYASGLIAQQAGGLDYVSGERLMSVDKVVHAFNKAADDKNVRAILFRINSPGGTPEASETIRHAVVHAREKGKPVFVSMGSMATSGGYWIAMDADHIVANPGTITGSIGVVGGKIVVTGAANKLGVSFGKITTDDNAGMWSMAEEFTPAQRARVKFMLDETYDIFTQGVATGRKIPLEKIADIAKGRVWSGQAAATNGLVDELGGFDVTLHALRQKLALADDVQLNIQQYPRPESMKEKLMKAMRASGLSGFSSLFIPALMAEWQDTMRSVLNTDTGFIAARAPMITIY